MNTLLFQIVAETGASTQATNNANTDEKYRDSICEARNSHDIVSVYTKFNFRFYLFKIPPPPGLHFFELRVRAGPMYVLAMCSTEFMNLRYMKIMQRG